MPPCLQIKTRSTAGNIKSFFSEIRGGLEQDRAMQNMFTNATDIESTDVKPEETSAGVLPLQYLQAVILNKTGKAVPTST